MNKQKNNIIVFEPVYKNYIWGGEKLNSIYKKNSGYDKTAESWELSVHPDGENIICGGDYDGMCLSDYIKSNPTVLGTNRKSDELPVLIKLIDAEDRLSVQVHPDDAMAKKLENQFGKTEMWYVIDASDDAKIIFGVKEDITKEQLKKSISQNTLEDILNSVVSKKGDVFFVESGTIHAIGKGNLIAEIQQNSNVTYRLYDYGRRDKNGNLRELHIDKGVMASNVNKQETKQISACSDGSRLIASCEYFAVKEFVVSDSVKMQCHKESYQALLCVEGQLDFASPNESKSIRAGELVFIPAGYGEYSLIGNGKVLVTQNPPGYYIGIDLGGTNIASAVVDEYGNTYGYSKRKTAMPRPYSEILDNMVCCAKDAAYISGIDWEDIVCVGVGCPGAINKETGMVDFSNNLDFYDVPLVNYLENALNKKVYIENDANAAAWGEFVEGSGKNTNNMILLTLGTGVGSGVIINGHLFRGSFGTGAELGHMVIVTDGVQCTCGRKGCLESYASATGLINIAKEFVKENKNCQIYQKTNGDMSKLNGKTIFETSDDTSVKIINTYLSYLSEGIVNIVNMFQPEVICIGGGISGAGDSFVKRLQTAVEEKAFARFGKKHTQIKVASLGNDAGIVGAALLWKEYTN